MMNIFYKSMLFLLFCLASSVVFASGPGQTPVSGYVLTASDSNGDATWTAAGAVGGWSTGTVFTTTGSNNVGIGTWAPAQPLHVNGHCVTGDTILRRRRRRKDGTYDYDGCRIDAIEAGDEILSLNEETGSLEYQRVNALLDKARSKLNMVSRYFALAKVPVLLSSKEAVMTRELRGDNEFFVFKGSVEGVNVKAIVRAYKGGTKHFYSVIWQGEIKEEEKKQGAASRLYPRCGGMVTPQLQMKYNAFMAGVSSILMAKSKGVFDKLTVETKVNACPKTGNGNWIKVSELKKGDFIATLSSPNVSGPQAGHSQLFIGDTGHHAHFERVTKIELLSPQQVWDVEIANTHNFVGNDIIAHNTYITGNLGLGILPPSTGWTSTIEINKFF